MNSSSTGQSAPQGPGPALGAPNLPLDDRTELREGYAEVGDVRLHYVEAGDGPLIVLLHGFPEFWFSWRLQIAPLAAAGFRVLAPDLRGYNLSSRPADVEAYSPTGWPPTSAVLSESSVPSPRCWSGTTGAEPSPGRPR